MIDTTDKNPAAKGTNPQMKDQSELAESYELIDEDGRSDKADGVEQVEEE